MLFGRKKDKEIEEKNIITDSGIKLPTMGEIEQQTGKLEVKKEFPATEAEKSFEPTTEAESGLVQPLLEKRGLEERKMIKEELKWGLPLFVKIDKYEEIMNNIGELEEVLSLMRSSLALLEESEKIKVDVLKAIEESLNKIEEKIASLSSTLSRPHAYEKKEKGMKDPLLELRLQIEKLKQETQSL